MARSESKGERIGGTGGGVSGDIVKDLEQYAGADFACIGADPPWRFKSNSAERPGRNAGRHYPTMTLREIEALPVRDVIAKDAICWLWITGPLLVLGAHIPILRAWGFQPTAIGFVWIKLNKRAGTLFLANEDIFMGGGFTTRKNAEFCIIGKRGRSLRQSAKVREVIISPVREHSRKPDEFYKSAEEYSPGPRLDLFGLKSRPGWTVLGNEARKFDEMTL